MDSSTLSNVAVAAAFFLLGIITTYLIGVRVNMDSPRIQAYLDKRAIAVRSKKVSLIVKEYMEVKALRQTLSEAILRLALDVVNALQAIALLVFIGVTLLFNPAEEIAKYTLANGLLALCMLALEIITFSELMALQRRLRRCMSFTSYQQNVKARLQELGANLQELTRES